MSNLVEIGDCGQWVSGGTPRKSNPTFWGGDIPWISAKSLKQFDLSDSQDRVTELGAKEVGTVPAGTIIFVVRGMSLAKEFRVGLTTREVTFNQDLRAIIPAKNVDARYLTRILQAAASRILARVTNAGHGTKRLPTDDMKAVKIPLPALSEQRRIAGILDTADSIHRKRQQAIGLTEQFLRSTFLDMFGDPVTNPMGWPVMKLGEAIDFRGGSQPPKNNFVGAPRSGYVRLVQIRDFKTDKYATYIPKELAKRSFTVQDVMIARYGPPVFQILRGLEGSYNVALMKASPKNDNITRDFIFHVLQLPFIHDVVVANSERTAGQSGVNLRLLNNIDLPLPQLSVQKEMSVRISSIESQQKRNRVALQHCNNLFNSLVQRAFKGEL